MSIVTAALQQWTIEDWHAEFSHREDGRYELVRGRSIMTPTEANRNLSSGAALLALLHPRLKPDWQTIANTSIRLSDVDQPTIRVPDLTVIRADVDPHAWLNNPTDVALVVEFVSPGSAETDWIAKRAEYAAAGIPAYLIVDVTSNPPYVVLLDTLIDTPDGPNYADPDTDGSTATLHIGDHTITLTAAELA